jgi:hypothetical protein
MRDDAHEADMDSLIAALEVKINSTSPAQSGSELTKTPIRATKLERVLMFKINIPASHQGLVKELRQHPQVKLVSGHYDAPVHFLKTASMMRNFNA